MMNGSAYGNGNNLLVKIAAPAVAILLAVVSYYVRQVDSRAAAAELGVAKTQAQVQDTRDRTIRLEVQVESLGDGLRRLEGYGKETTDKLDRLLEGRPDDERGGRH